MNVGEMDTGTHCIPGLNATGYFCVNKVPEEVLDMTHQELAGQPPTEAEGFDGIISSDELESFEHDEAEPG